MASRPVTEWFPLPEVDEDNESWERPHTTSKAASVSVPGTAPLQQPGSHSNGTIQPLLQRPRPSSSHPMTPLVFNLDSSPPVSSGQPSTLLYTPAEATSHSRQRHYDSKKTAHRARERTSVTPRYQTIPEAPMSSANTSTLAPTSSGDLTISSLLSTSGQRDRSEVVTGQDPPYPPTHHIGGVASSDKLTGLSSGGYYVDTASSTTTVGGYSTYGALESSRTHCAPPPPTVITTTQQTPTLTLTELDELWRRFLATSLGSRQPPLRYNQISGGREIDHHTTAAATGSGGQSTNHRPQVTPALPPSVDTSHTRMQELLATHGKREDNVSKPARTYTKPSETTQLGFASRHIHLPSNTKGKPLSHSRKVHMQDTSVQTTPSLHVSHPPPRSAISFSIPKQQTPVIEEEEELLEQRTHTLTQLTLHEALTVFRPDFIQQSCERQRALREGQWRRRRREGGHRPPPVGCREEVPQSKRTPKFFFVDASNCRPRMSMRQMYEQTKRYWHRLPEVQQKVRQEKRKSEAATNRLRVKLYQKEVLARLRQRKTRN